MVDNLFMVHYQEQTSSNPAFRKSGKGSIFFRIIELLFSVRSTNV